MIQSAADRGTFPRDLGCASPSSTKCSRCALEKVEFVSRSAIDICLKEFKPSIKYIWKINFIIHSASCCYAFCLYFDYILHMHTVFRPCFYPLASMICTGYKKPSLSAVFVFKFSSLSKYTSRSFKKIFHQLVCHNLQTGLLH